jgi:hypothetical protein
MDNWRELQKRQLAERLEVTNAKQQAEIKTLLLDLDYVADLLDDGSSTKLQAAQRIFLGIQVRFMRFQLETMQSE